MPDTPKILTEEGLLDELTYLNYAHNRKVNKIPAEMFKRYYSNDEVDQMEARFQEENGAGKPEETAA